MEKKASEALGVTFNGSVTFNGPMFDIHDNQHVHIGMSPMNKATGENEKMRACENDRLAAAIASVQQYMWGNSAYAVVFCVLRDRYEYRGSMSQFERDMQSLAETTNYDWACPSGTLRAAFQNNPYMRKHLDSWKKAGVPDRVMLLADKFEDFLQTNLHK